MAWTTHDSSIIIFKESSRAALKRFRGCRFWRDILFILMLIPLLIPVLVLVLVQGGEPEFNSLIEFLRRGKINAKL